MGSGGTPLLEWNEKTSLPIVWFVCLLGLKKDKKVRRSGVVSVLWSADRKGRRR